ncbi:MAG TPA: hypothetical protein VLV83_20720 [Acidobacteriota bacterium]|nr:hypothetical protein [Acidobacteriota bacterium]
MGKILHARIDKKTEKQLREIKLRFGWNDSEAVREGIKALSSLLTPSEGRTIVGIGEFESGIADLGSNKRHLDGFGE